MEGSASSEGTSEEVRHEGGSMRHEYGADTFRKVRRKYYRGIRWRFGSMAKAGGVDVWQYSGKVDYGKVGNGAGGPCAGCG